MKKILVITGASDGIGLETAKRFLAADWTVVNLSRRPSDAPGIHNIKTDVTDEDAVKNAFRQIEEQFGKIDVLVNNAGFGIAGAVEFTSLEDAKKQFDVNFFGVVSCCKAAVPLLRKTKGRIINISSAASVFAIPFQSFYSATKASVDVLTKALANELKPWGVSVCALRLGDVRTSFTAARKKSFDGDDVYGGVIGRSVAVMEQDERNGMEPSLIAEAVYQAAIKKKVPVISTVGMKYKVLTALSGLLPNEAVNDLIAKIYMPKG